MPRSPVGPGIAIYRVGGGQISHEERIKKCNLAVRAGWVDDGTGRYPENWTAADVRAWKLEQASVAATEALIRDVIRGGNMAAKQQELYFKLIGTGELKAGNVNVNIGKQTTNIIQSVTVEVIGSNDLLPARQQQQQQQLPAAGAEQQGDVVEGEAVEVQEVEAAG